MEKAVRADRPRNAGVRGGCSDLDLFLVGLNELEKLRAFPDTTPLVLV
jgi:hypothetical protein